MVQANDRLKVLQQLGRTYRAFLSAYEKEVGHYLPRWRIMLHLYTYERPCPQKQLGDSSHMDPGALSRQLGMLESLGWIVRSTASQDKRITNVLLTEEGKREVEKGLPKRAAFIERTLGDISDKQLHQLMEALLLLETRFTPTGKPQTANEDVAA
ncbi:MAG TPA: MarR family winged helix-turn-helix transcriptional regulator [Burkholderiaceae bacterium]|nr:MarR family winged helix-turn-helix transcriptional regulator [Burkholderiaceae bacterium]